MATITKDDFLRCVKSSKVIDEKVFADVMQQVDAEDPKQIAIQLVSRKLLTKWQAKYLISGRHVLQIGNYQLLERMKRDDMGDRFLAVHLQLGRKVEIQLFPAELTKNEEQRESFISTSSAAVTIDHPNVVHVYDIDQEGGRLFLVVEHIEGQPLSEYPVEDLSDVDVGRIVKQISSGISEAHKAKLVHGQLTSENILITSDELAKLQNLSMSSLAELAVKTEPRDDFNSLGKLGVQLLARTKRSVGPQAKKTLFDLLSWLGTTDEASVPKIVAKLDDWIIKHNEETQNTIKSLEGKASQSGIILEHPANRAVPAGGLHIPGSSTAAKTKSKNGGHGKSNKAEEVADSKKVSPKMLVATLVIGGLLLIGGVTMFAIAMMGGKTNERGNVANTAKTSNDKTESAKGKKVNSRTKAASTLGEGIDDKALQDMLAAGKEKKPDRGAPDNNPTKDTVQPANASVKPDPVNSEPAKTEPATTTPPAEVANTKPPASNTETVATSTPKDKPAVDKPEEKDATANNAGPQADESKPFKDFPRNFDLPAIEDTKPVLIGNIYSSKNYLLAAELMTGEEICKSKIAFEMKRDENNNQRWIINFQRRKSDDPVSVAAFYAKEKTIYFEWLPIAKDHEYAQYFRNCGVKFTAKDRIGFLSLRKPLIIEGFAISAEQLETKIETELQWLPDPDFLVVELQPFKYGDLGGIFANRFVNKKNPGYVYFSEKQNQKFAWLEVTSDLRKKLRLNLELKIQGAPSSKRSLKFLASTAFTLKEIADKASFDYNQIKDAQKHASITVAEFNANKKRMKADAEQAQTIAADTIELQSRLPSLFDKQIPFTIFFEMNGARTVLAESKVSQ